MTDTQPLLTLRFQELTTQVQSAPGADSVVNLALPIAPAPLAREVLRHTPPTPLEIEQAIEWVEDAVMPARARLPEAFELQVEDAPLRELVGSAGADPSTGGVARLSIQDVENLFSRLVALSEGRPATQDGLPSDGASATRLIILREVLHHWGVQWIALAAQETTDNRTQFGSGP